MLKRLISIFKGDYPLQRASSMFEEMLKLCREMVLEADAIYWGGSGMTAEQRSALYDKDVRVNQLERRIRKMVVTTFSSPVPSDVPHGLLLMSLVKDVERLGDYAKNLTEIARMTHPESARGELPQDDICNELREIGRFVVKVARDAERIYCTSDRDRAEVLTVEGRSVAKRCDQLVTRIAQSDYSADLAVELTLAARFYKRLNGHQLNVLSSVLMPLHKLDFYDEQDVMQD
jgi:phosphate uptake regulator